MYRYRVVENNFTEDVFLYVFDTESGEDFLVKDNATILSVVNLFQSEEEELIQEAIGNIAENRNINDDIALSEASIRIRELVSAGDVVFNSADDSVIIDGQEIPGEVTRLMNTIESEEDVQSLRNFVSRLQKNPSARARRDLFAWIAANESLSITPSGHVIGFRGVDSTFHSLHSGFGYINGKSVNGKHDNSIGNVLSVPREMVDPDINHGCSFGLHIGSVSYASQFAPHNGHVMAVAFDPADAVVIPHLEARKIRVCRFAVLGEVTRNTESITEMFSHDFDVPSDMELDNISYLKSILEPEEEEDDDFYDDDDYDDDYDDYDDDYDDYDDEYDDSCDDDESDVDSVEE